MKKWLILSVIVLVSLILLVSLIGLMVLPHYATRYLNEHGKEYTGRKISVEEISLDYFHSKLVVRNFKMYEADGQQTFVGFDTLLVDIKPWPLLSSRLEVEQIRLVKPEMRIVKSGGGFNFDDILAFVKAKQKPEPEAAKPTKPFSYDLSRISMEKGTFTFVDKTVDHTSVLNDLGFSIPYLSFNQHEIKDAGFQFHLEHGGTVSAKAFFDRLKGAYKIDLQTTGLDISPFLPYMKPYFKLTSLQGVVKGDFHVEGHVDNLDSVMIRGKGHVDDFSVADFSGKKVLAAKQGDVTIDETYPMKFNFRFGTIDLEEPFLYVEMKDSTINLMNLMVESPADTVPFVYAYDISHFRIRKGLIDLRDNSLEEPFDYHLSEIEMNVDSLSSASKWIKTYATMRLNKRGKLQAELGINPNDFYDMSVKYVLTNFQLTDLNLYSKHYVGFPILLGNMYYKGNTLIHNRQLASENKLIIRNAKLGKKHGGLMNLPLKLALYLLTDINGDITLDLPLSGDLNDPKTNVRKLVWATLKNVIVKVVASPFLAMSHLLGVDPTEVKGLEFGYADTTLTATHLRRIKNFVAIEGKKPDMKVELQYLNDDGLERDEIALREAGKLFKAATGKDAERNESLFGNFLKEKLQSDSLSVQAGCLKLVGKERVDSLQKAVGNLRIRKIEAALHAISDATRIKVVFPDAQSPDKVGSRPVFELKYSTED
ncbi:MAG: DUF748 domain-containing protein [Marinilabiliales bacterium]|nr:DUF748 domain-containing protein [Marinilabiliales bacterium]